MNKYLLEIGVEELPARFVELAIEQLEEKSGKILRDNNIDFADVKVFATPRRLSLIVDDISENQADIKKEIKGPAEKISFDEDHNPTKPLEGFMRSQKIELSDIAIKDVNGTNYVFATIEKKGEDTKSLLKDLMPELIRDINFPRNMRWGGKHIKFARPIRWVVSLFNDEVVEFDFENIPVGRTTRGHRFLGDKIFDLRDVDEYKERLRENYVILDQTERRDMIDYESKKLAKSLGGHIKKNDDLLEELTYIVEYPTPISGRIEDKFLSLPKEVITTTMIDHLRYLPVYDLKDELLPYFITIRNGSKEYADIVASGNERVLRARLEDAKFFFEDDTSVGLEEYVDKLNGLIFHEKLGNMAQKSKRLEELALILGDELQIAEESKNSLKRVAYLSKADLNTKMVTEFTELEGIMGSIYAKLAGEDEIVTKAIYEQYLPKGKDDDLPSSTVGSIISIADKLDTICGLFAIDLAPTGSQDPFALRRAAIGIINIIKNKNWSIDLEKIVGKCLYNYADTISQTFDYEDVKSKILNFFDMRIKNMLQDEGIRYDIIESVIGERDINKLFIKAGKLNCWFAEDRTEFIDSFKRIKNLSKTEFKEVDPSKFQTDEERNLWDRLKEVEPEFERYISERKFDEAMDELNKLCDNIQKLFDNVMIMAKEPEIKENRISLISLVESKLREILDISKIVD